jgi:eukaryotic translation initiation factor 2C
MKITPQMLEVDSTILRYPAIIYENNSTVNLYNEFIKRDNYGETPRWTLNKRNFLDVGPAQNVGVQVFLLAPPTTGTSDDQSASALRTAILNALKRYNIGRGPKKLLSFITIHTLEENSLRTALTEAKEHFSEGRKKLVILQLPNRDRYIYPIFKDLADREFGLQAICVTESKMFQWDEGNNRTIKNIEQYLGNVMMKANLKCEGINHSAGGAIIDGNTNYKTAMTDVIRETMVLGADVTHPSLNSVEGCPSIAAIVGSVDDYGGKFLGSMRLQDQEKKDREVSSVRD